ncbi:MAG: hypothetical protein KDH88_13985 [Chromatiales bacterium]|nr:hypothetical protein [Chromatiales bacterium]
MTKRTYPGYKNKQDFAVLEAAYHHGNADGHLAVGVEDCRRTCTQIHKNGRKIIRKATLL